MPSFMRRSAWRLWPRSARHRPLSAARSACDIGSLQRAAARSVLVEHCESRHRPAGRGDERVAGGDQVQELHRPVDIPDRRCDRTGVLKLVAGLPTAFSLGMGDLEAGDVIAHRLERDVRPAQQVRGSRGCHLLVAGEFIHHPGLVHHGRLGRHLGPFQEVAGHRRSDLVVLGHGVDRGDLLLRCQQCLDAVADSPAGIVRCPPGFAVGRRDTNPRDRGYCSCPGWRRRSACGVRR